MSVLRRVEVTAHMSRRSLLNSIRHNSTTATSTKEQVAEPSNTDIVDSTELTAGIETNSIEPKQFNSLNVPYDGCLEQLSEMSNNELDTLLNSKPNPTLNREDILTNKFKNLLNLYSNRDQLKKKFNSSSSLLSKFPNLIPSDKNLPYTEAELTVRQKYFQSISGNLGSNIKNIYKPHKLILNPPNINQISIEKLIASGAHLGRSTSLFNQNFQPFIYGTYKGLHIIDIEKTCFYLKNACKIIEKTVENGGLVLFLGLKIGQLRSIKEASNKCNGYYVARKWIPGSITNSLENPKPRHEIDMQELPTNRELNSDEANKIIKPDLIIFLNPELATVAIKEANQARIPTIGIIDSNVDPNIVTYPIPANSNSNRTTNLITGVLGKSGETGLNRRLTKVSEYKKNLGLEENDVFLG